MPFGYYDYVTKGPLAAGRSAGGIKYVDMAVAWGRRRGWVRIPDEAAEERHMHEDGEQDR